jgi:hypothetical protein
MNENVYDCECEGCGETVSIYIEGFIGMFEDVWCDKCGYGGENMKDEEIDREMFVKGCLEENLLKNISFDGFGVDSSTQIVIDSCIENFYSREDESMKRTYALIVYQCMKAIGAY